jgi:hypothetical protein
VTPPSWRFDLQIEEDLIEEVARVIGYDKLPTTRAPLAPVTARVRAEAQSAGHTVRHALAALGLPGNHQLQLRRGAMGAELAGNADPIQVLNPIAAPLAVMRSSLMGSLVKVLSHNLARKASACGCSRWAVCSGAMPTWPLETDAWPASPADARGRPGLRPGRCRAVGVPIARSTSST